MLIHNIHKFMRYRRIIADTKKRNVGIISYFVKQFFPVLLPKFVAQFNSSEDAPLWQLSEYSAQTIHIS